MAKYMKSLTRNRLSIQIADVKSKIWMPLLPQDSINGADVVVKNTGRLPSNYISYQKAIDLGMVI